LDSTLEFSAQFGSREAAEAVLPHFRILKSVARKYSLPQFPFKSMAFVLRVDGEISSFGLSGLGNIDFKGKKYVSVDIGISQEDYVRNTKHLSSVISDAIVTSASFLQQVDDERMKDIDFAMLREALNDFSKSYLNASEDV